MENQHGGTGAVRSSQTKCSDTEIADKMVIFAAMENAQKVTNSSPMSKESAGSIVRRLCITAALSNGSYAHLLNEDVLKSAIDKI